MEELKPCPFCGGEAKINRIVNTFYQYARYFSSCTRCSAESKMFETEQEAIEAWNTRTERTCFVQYEYTGEPFFHSIHVHELSCGHDVRLYEDAPIYCPYCGAKVV